MIQLQQIKFGSRLRDMARLQGTGCLWDERVSEMKRIPVASLDVTGNENAYISEAIRSTWISSAGKFKEIPGIGFQRVALWAEFSPWNFAITVNPREFGCSRDDLMACLAARGVETQPMFLPLHHMPPFREQARQRDEVFPVTDRLGTDGMMLPTFSQLSDADLRSVVEAVASALGVSREVLPSFVRNAGAA
jgi:dTDP-4-amino-4,6-dideoxygalactose transaminase